MGDVRAKHAPEGLVNPAVAWGTLGAHVVNAKGAHGALEWGAVSVRSFPLSLLGYSCYQALIWQKRAPPPCSAAFRSSSASPKSA